MLVWWILERSTLGFELKAVGANPDAARTAGMNVAKVYTVAMLLAGAFAGLAATMQINGDHAQISDTLIGTIGFDAITVALLRSEEHTSELQSLMRISYAVFCL